MLKRPFPLLLFLILFSLYLLSYSATFHSSDGLAMFATAESLVRRGAWDIEQIGWMGLQQGTYGLDGLLYSRKGLGQPLLALPFTWLGLALPGFGPATVTLLFGAVITPFTAVLIFLYLKALNFSNKTGFIAGLVFGTATLAWPYAKTFFSDTLAGTLLLITALSLLLFSKRGQKRYAFIAGLALAWAVATRYAEAVFLLVFGLLFLAYLFERTKLLPPFPKREMKQLSSLPLGGSEGEPDRRKTKAIGPLLAFCAPIAVIGISLLTFNFLRYGNPLNTGYLPQETFSAVWWQGILGQLISPGRGLLLYNPILWLTFFGLRPFYRQHRLEFWPVLAVILIHLLLYGKWFMWHGGFAWGPRFMVATLPFWLILMAPVIERLSQAKTWQKGTFYALWGLSLVLQIPALTVNFDLWQNRLLESNLPLFAPITFFGPLYSPLLQTWQFINPVNLDMAWASQGNIAWSIVALLIINLGIVVAVAYYLLSKPERPKANIILAGASIFTLITTALLLNYAHKNQAPELQALMAQINALPSAPLMYNEPQIATGISELYTGSGPVWGLLTASEAQLADISASTDAVWFLQRQASNIESHLLQNHALAHQQSLKGLTLSLFAQANGPVEEIKTDFEDGISLRNIQTSTELEPNTALAVTLNWKATAAPENDYTIFIHLLNANGETIAQSDGQPVHWTRPTSSWQVDETIADRHALWIPELGTGQYSLIAGLYLPESGERLITTTAEDFVILKTVEVSAD